jgi:hypothetical protein
MFWNGERWIDERPAVPAGSTGGRHERVKRWLATVPILLLVPALAIPFVITTATSTDAQLTLQGKAYAGATVKLVGTRFPASTSMSVMWDDTKSLKTFTSGGDGAFTVSVQIPRRTTVGSHELAVYTAATKARTTSLTSTTTKSRGKQAPPPTAAPTPAPTAAPSGPVQLASVTVDVETPATPTPDPTPVPTPKPKPPKR